MNTPLSTTNSDAAVSALPTTTVEEMPSALNATTKFEEDSSGVMAAPIKPLTINSDLYLTSTDNCTQDIKTFLAKPNVIVSGNFTTTDVIGSFTNYAMPFEILNKPIVSNKLSGYYGLRCTLVFRLVVNATRFQQGRYLLSWYPSGGNFNTATTIARNFHANTLRARTQAPHVEIDLACDTSCVLSIPYVSAYNHISLQNIILGKSATGSIVISPYSALEAGSGSTTAGFTLYAHMEDVELIGVAAPQSGISDKEKKPVGKVTSVLTSIKSFTDTLKNFPTLSSYATPLSWVTDISLNAAKTVGWSKPFTESGTNRTVRDSAFGLCNTDVVDLSKKQALFSNNSVGVLPGYSGTDVDELAISGIATRLSSLKVLEWTTAQTSGTSLWSDGVTPTSVSTTETRVVTGGLVVTDYTPLQWCSEYFNYWRGSIVYKFKFVKTEFHSGRLAFCFFPSETSLAGPTTSYASSNYVHRAIVDIRDCNEYTVTVPYISSTPYKMTTGAASYTGSFQVYIVDPLQAPDTVTNHIGILVEVAGGSDIEFAVPSNVSMTPCYNVTPQSGTPPNACALGDVFLGASSVHEHTTVNSEACIGERVLSFRSLLKVFVDNSFTTLPIAGKFLSVVPFAVSACYDTALSFHPTNTGDHYSAFSSIFLFSRGGVRFKIAGIFSDIYRPMYSFTKNDMGSTSFNYLARISGTGADQTSQWHTNHLSSASTVHNVGANTYAEVEIPQYNMTHSRINYEHLVNVNIPYVLDVAKTTSRSVLTFTNTSTNFNVTESFVYRAMADDGDFGCFISIGPMYKGIIRAV